MQGMALKKLTGMVEMPVTIAPQTIAHLINESANL
jgi:hypothetical protein